MLYILHFDAIFQRTRPIANYFSPVISGLGEYVLGWVRYNSSPRIQKKKAKPNPAKT